MDTETEPGFDKKFQIAIKVWNDNFPWHQRVLKVTFLYPFQNRIVQLLGNLTLLSSLVILLVTSILKLITELENDINLSTSVEMIFQLVAFSMMIFCYLFMIFNKANIYKGTVLMARMWLVRDDVQERKIEYGKTGYFLSNLQAASILILIMSFGSAPVAIPLLLNWVLPGNRTFDKTLPFHTEFFVDEEEYFYQIFAAQLFLTFIYGLLIVSLNYLQCAAVIFLMGEIRCFQYMFEKMNEEYQCKMEIDEKQANKWVCEQLKDLLRWQQLCIEYYSLVQKKSSFVLFILLSGCSSTIVLTGTSMVILVETDVSAAAKMLFAFVVTLSAVIFICIPSQLLKNSSEDFYISSCQMNGEVYSPKIRKMLIFIMMRLIQPFALTAGPTIELNLETCSTIIKSSLSYVATFRSVYNSQ